MSNIIDMYVTSRAGTKQRNSSKCIRHTVSARKPASRHTWNLSSFPSEELSNSGESRNCFSDTVCNTHRADCMMLTLQHVRAQNCTIPDYQHHRDTRTNTHDITHMHGRTHASTHTNHTLHKLDLH